MTRFRMGPSSCNNSQLDPKLLRVIEEAEAGQSLPSVSLIVGGWLVRGVPVGASQFLMQAESELKVQLRSSISGKELRSFRGREHELDHFLVENVTPLMAWTTKVGVDDDGAVITLNPATFDGPLGRLEVTVAGIPCRSVDSW